MRVSVTEYLAPAKVLVCTKCFQIGHFRSTCSSGREHCTVCGVGVDDLIEHKKVCNNKVCCIRCKGSHESNDVRCPDIKSFRSILTKSLLDSSGATIHQQQVQHTRFNNINKDKDLPVLDNNYNCNTNFNRGGNNKFNNTSKRIDELFVKMNKLDDNLNR
jgi:hypothetical protein